MDKLRDLVFLSTEIIIESNLISNKDIDSGNFIEKAVDAMGYLFN